MRVMNHMKLTLKGPLGKAARLLTILPQHKSP